MGAPLAVFEAAFAHEQHINGRIDHKVEVANQLRMVGDDGRGILMLDRELGTRTYIAPTAPYWPAPRQA